eukprot:TRINITY_DN10118_c0_g1_i1.p1 TRINITY_DN10118_c0_g1~~TRINITY_DN10118_c0_g1_i1.p1  ORF type:complete len:142 (-),score=26.30 TRINITY_DN10118_c0_g1_i1:559-984(-)
MKIKSMSYRGLTRFGENITKMNNNNTAGWSLSTIPGDTLPIGDLFSVEISSNRLIAVTNTTTAATATTTTTVITTNSSSSSGSSSSSSSSSSTTTTQLKFLLYISQIFEYHTSKQYDIHYYNRSYSSGRRFISIFFGEKFL